MTLADRLRATGALAAARGRAVAPLRLAFLGTVIMGTAAAGVAAALPVATASFVAGSTASAGQAALVSLPAYGARGTDVLDYHDGAEVILQVPLRNAGRFPVTVTDVALDAGAFELLSLVSGPADFVLGPGTSRAVALRVRLGNCRYYHEREVRTYDGLRVSFTTVGGQGSRFVPLVRPITVHSPMIIGCGDRKLDRSAVNRTPGSRAG